MSNAHVKNTAVFNGVDFRIWHYWQRVLGGRGTLKHQLLFNTLKFATGSRLRSRLADYVKSSATLGSRDGASRKGRRLGRHAIAKKCSFGQNPYTATMLTCRSLQYRSQHRD